MGRGTENFTVFRFILVALLPATLYGWVPAPFRLTYLGRLKQYLHYAIRKLSA